MIFFNFIQWNLQLGIKTEVRILLAKIQYASALYEETLDELSKSGFDNMVEIAQNVRHIQLIAEAHAMRAHCLEKVT